MMDPSVQDFQSRMIDSRALNELPDHSGQPRPAEVEFFAEPPMEIGEVLTAESTLRPGRKGMPFSMRMMIGLILAGVIVFTGDLLARDAMEVDQGIIKVAGYVLGAAALGITLLVTRFKAVCSFVGENGMASMTLKGGRHGRPKVQVLQFEKAEELRAKQTRQYYNGIYTGTTYEFTWTGPGGQRLWRTAGTYRDSKKGLRAGDPFRLLQAAEIVWSGHFVERANKILETEGSVPFRIDKRRVVRVGQGFLEFHFGDKPLRLTTEDIASVSIADGTFQFKHKDAKWYSLTGRYTFAYGNMANARVFLMALENLMGYQWN